MELKLTESEYREGESGEFNFTFNNSIVIETYVESHGKSDRDTSADDEPCNGGEWYEYFIEFVAAYDEYGDIMQVYPSKYMELIQNYLES